MNNYKNVVKNIYRHYCCCLWLLQDVIWNLFVSIVLLILLLQIVVNRLLCIHCSSHLGIAAQSMCAAVNI